VSAFVINSYAFGGEDPDAKTYLDAVETADTQALEAAVRKAVDDFVKGLKSDGLWSAIKACCILMGARTLSGALTPLVGSAPTNVSGNFVSGDYDRETGLVGNASNKALDSNRANNADPQDDQHMALYVSALGNANTVMIGAANTGVTGATQILLNASLAMFTRSRNGAGEAGAAAATGFFGISRASSSEYTRRNDSATSTDSRASQTPATETVGVFCRKSGSSYITHTNARIAFYSIGESLTLADLDSRVDTLYDDLAAAI
jgi:hypothetical protein